MTATATDGKSAALGWCPSRALLVVLLAGGLLLSGHGLWIMAKAELAQLLLDRAFAQSLATGRPVKPWSWADTWPVARIEVPRLGLARIVLDGGSGQALAFAPGHLHGSAVPGERGTAVYAAHRDTHFRFLGRLRPGDRLDVSTSDGRRISFGVTGARIVRWDRFAIDPHAHPSLALVTCWPLDSIRHGPLRYVVHAEQMPARYA